MAGANLRNSSKVNITMNDNPSRYRPILAITLIAGALLFVPRAHAATNLLKGYIGASFGHANLRARDTGLISAVPGSRLGSFDVGHSAFQLAAGVRALEFLGAEVDYFDLGSGDASPSWSGVGSITNAHVSQKGEAAFAMLYLPVPFIDLYLKAGAARLTTNLYAQASSPTCPAGYACPAITCPVGGCPTFSANGSRRAVETTFAGGVGVQLK